MLLTSLSSYTNLAAPNPPVNASASPNQPQSGKSKFGFVPNKELVKLNPCQIVLESFQVSEGLRTLILKFSSFRIPCRPSSPISRWSRSPEC